MANKLKLKRLEKGLSQAKLAEKAGTNVRVLQHYEQDYKNFNHARLDTLLKYCLALECKLSDLIDDHEILDLLNKYE